MDDALRTEIQRYSEERPPLAGRLEFFGRLWDSQMAITADAPPHEPPDALAVREALAAGRPVLLVGPPEIPLDRFLDALTEVTDLFTSSDVIDGPMRDFLADADIGAHVSQNQLDSVVEDVDGFCSDVADASGAQGDTRRVVRFALVETLSPFLVGPASSVVAQTGPIDHRLWTSGDCPVCGTPASVARIVDSGKLEGDVRLLACPLCRTEWTYDRMRCARCGSRDHGKLRYLFDESDPMHRVHVCDECRGYLKVTDEREAGRRVRPQVEDVATLVMDVVAKDRGYSPLGSPGLSDSDAMPAGPG